MNETSKATLRRRQDTQFDWNSVLQGKGLDIGAGNDPLLDAQWCDLTKDGQDAQILSNYYDPESFDFLYASHLLEHLHDPRKALIDWMTLLKPGGRIICIIPDFRHYEKLSWPSQFNSDHKTAWSLDDLKSNYPLAPLIHVPSFLLSLNAHGLETLRLELILSNFNFKVSSNIDQTMLGENVECCIEFVLRLVNKVANPAQTP
jgi:SAM-dependent methyltransferase